MTIPYRNTSKGGASRTDYGAAILSHLPPLAVLDELQEAGLSVEDIRTALITQQRQRQRGLTPYPLRVICGLDAREDARPTVLDALRFSCSDAISAAIAAARPADKPKRGGLHITRRPIHGGSVQTGSPEEADFIRPLTETQRAEIKRATFRIEEKAIALRALSRSGERALTHEEGMIAAFKRTYRDVILTMLDEEKHWKGWVLPCYETIAHKARVSRSTAFRALQALRSLGFLDWIRRYVFTPDDVLGARQEQTSNLYRLALPTWLRKFIGMTPPPVPDDTDLDRQISLEATAQMIAALPPRERATALPSDPAERAALFAAALAADFRAASDTARADRSRECQKGTAPPPYRFYSSSNMRNGPSRAML